MKQPGLFTLFSLLGHFLTTNALVPGSIRRQLGANTNDSIANSTGNPGPNPFYTDGEVDTQTLLILSEANSSMITNVSSSSRTLTSAPDATQNNILYRGFRISRCTSEQEETLLPIIDSLVYYAKNTAYEAKKGSASKFGYGALFRDNGVSSQVANLFLKMAAGSPASSPGLNANTNQLSPVQIMCVNPGDQYLSFYNDYDQNNPDSKLLASALEMTNMMVLYSRFFQQPIKPPPSYCPTIVNGKPSPADSSYLQSSQITTLAHELVHIYLQAAAIPEGPEAYSIGDAVALKSPQSLNSPSNYAFFMGAVAAKCIAWPAPPDELRIRGDSQ